MKQAGMGQPVQIVRPNTKGGFQLHIEAVRKILLAGNVKHKPVVVISVTGKVRTGRSFLLNLFLLYLSTNKERDWLSYRDSPLEGFSWSTGSERHTTGIWLWSEVFLVTRPQGGEVAVLLMDTQGLFDIETTAKDCFRIFFFSAFISSVQVYNIASNIHEDDLNYLRPLVECGQREQAETGETFLFQKLLFLVRDWYFPSDAPYGEKGGEEILKRRLKTSPLQAPELKSLLENIRSTFSEITCFLMPYPGRKVAGAASTESCLLEMEEDFVLSVKELVHSLLAPENLVVKQISHSDITCGELVWFMEKYMDAGNAQFYFPRSILQVVADAHCNLAMMEAKKIHKDGLKKVCDVDNSYVRPEKLILLHIRLRSRALEEFSKRLVLGGLERPLRLRRQLEQELDDTFEQFFRENEAKKAGSFQWADLASGFLKVFGSLLGGPSETLRPTSSDSEAENSDDFCPIHKTSLSLQLRPKEAANTIRHRNPFHVETTKNESTAQAKLVE